MKMIAFIILLMTMPAAVNAANSEVLCSATEAASLKAGIVAAYGGEETIREIKRVYAKGDITAPGDAGVYERWFDRERKLRVETLYSRSSETRIFNGDKGWRGINDNPPAEVEGSPYLAMVYQHKQQDIPYGLLTDQYRIIDLGVRNKEGRDVRIVILEDSEKLPIRIFVDLKTFYIIKSEFFFEINGKVASLGAEFTDFRVVDKMPFPHRIINYGNGQKIGETRIRKYVLNTDMKEYLFNPEFIE